MSRPTGPYQPLTEGQIKDFLEQLLTAREVKDLLGCSLSYVYKITESGDLKCVCLPAFGSKKKVRRYRYRDVVELIERCS